MRGEVALHHKPRPAAGIVMPELPMPAGGVFAQMHIIVPCLAPRIRRGPLQSQSRAPVVELAHIPRAADRTVDPHPQAPVFFSPKILPPEATMLSSRA